MRVPVRRQISQVRLGSKSIRDIQILPVGPEERTTCFFPYKDSIKVFRIHPDNDFPCFEAASRNMLISFVLRRSEMVFFRNSLFETGGLPRRFFMRV